MDDLISRQKAIDVVSDCGICMQRIIDLPSAQPEQKHGKWLNAEHAPNYLCYCTCSVCGKRQTIEIANYCPNCGAKIGGDAE